MTSENKVITHQPIRPDQLISVEVLIAATITTAPVAISKADARKGMQLEECVELKVLGLNWNPDKNVLSLEVKGLVDSLGGLDNTKRCVLQTAARIFDPVGLIAPFVVRIKCLLQEIWGRGMDWDHDLPEDLRLKWITWCNEIRTLKEIVTPRNCLQDIGKGLQEIPIFCDASLRAYGATSYTRYVDNTGKCSVLFDVKNRVAPLKTLTLLRLELMAMELIGLDFRYF
ncbi:hypothetical protein HNY73_004124 [Argiope bruennichi]|uniref:Uncharacterized protein n=1 Tax=Argiope bruennichi TaxID=94029 RepID=A0A8T0FSQ5_ARGBR|nr:hypothetical protein HNY73_004124 [Argiope bruennichi]